MKEVQRWECRVATNANGRPYVDDIEFAAGRYVLHSDHEAVVDSMTAALVKLDGACLASEQEVARLRAEVEAYRKDAERRLDLIQATLENTEWRHGARNIHAELCREVDAAMGASA